MGECIIHLRLTLNAKLSIPDTREGIIFVTNAVKFIKSRILLHFTEIGRESPSLSATGVFGAGNMCKITTFYQY